MLQSININNDISQQTKRKFKIYHKVYCKSQYVIYLIECTQCNKQHIGKAETAFNIRLNNHRKDTKTPNAILASRHFQKQGHNSNSHVKFIIIDELVNTFSPKDILRERFIQQENFWIQKLKTLVPYRLNGTQQIENEDPLTAFLHSFLPRPNYI